MADGTLKKNRKAAKTAEEKTKDNAIANERLIDVVRKYPCLWEVSSQSHKDKIAKSNSWDAVRSELSSLPDASKVWTSWMISADLVWLHK